MAVSITAVLKNGVAVEIYDTESTIEDAFSAASELSGVLTGPTRNGGYVVINTDEIAYVEVMPSD
jgi:hypothetical protein